VHPHALFDGLAYAAGIQTYRVLAAGHRDALTVNQRWWVVAAAFLGAALGSKILPVIAHPSVIAEQGLNPLFLLGGKSIAGALVGGLISVEIAKRRMGITRSTGDPFAVPLVAGIAVGRIGCFLTGLEDHTHGLPAALPWAVDFGDGLARHPTQLYEAAFLMAALLPALWWRSRASVSNGEIFRWFMVGYFGFRLGLEFLKPGEAIAGLNAIQWTSVGVLTWYALAGLRQPSAQAGEVTAHG
jgi:prolipoprotein diacylglyceryltransferase